MLKRAIAGSKRLCRCEAKVAVHWQVFGGVFVSKICRQSVVSLPIQSQNLSVRSSLVAEINCRRFLALKGSVCPPNMSHSAG